MAKDKTKDAAAAGSTTVAAPGATAAPAAGEAKAEGQGSAVVLPNGERRIDYIRNEYYNKGVKRGEIRKAINEMLKAAGREGEAIAYQIVFQATKSKTDPRVKAPAAAAAAPAPAAANG